jgi:hypothetical protein
MAVYDNPERAQVSEAAASGIHYDPNDISSARPVYDPATGQIVFVMPDGTPVGGNGAGQNGNSPYGPYAGQYQNDPSQMPPNFLQNNPTYFGAGGGSSQGQASPGGGGGGGGVNQLLRYLIPGAGSVIDDILNRRANNQANGYLQGAVTDAQALQQRLYDQTTGTGRDIYERNSGLYEPYQQAGLQSLSTLLGLANQNRPDFQLPTLAEAQSMPGYQFGLDQGLKGVSNSAAARGGLLTGGAVKAADRYANDYATTKYGELANQKLAEYNANTANFDRPFNRNLALLGAGQYGTTGMANAGSDYADLMNRAGTAYTNASTDLVTGAANANAQTTLNNSNGDRRTIQNLADLFREYFGGRA